MSWYQESTGSPLREAMVAFNLSYSFCAKTRLSNLSLPCPTPMSLVAPTCPKTAHMQRTQKKKKTVPTQENVSLLSTRYRSPNSSDCKTLP